MAERTEQPARNAKERPCINRQTKPKRQTNIQQLLRCLLRRGCNHRRSRVWIRRHVGDLRAGERKEEEEECSNKFADDGDDMTADSDWEGLDGFVQEACGAVCDFAVVVVAGGVGEHFEESGDLLRGGEW